MTSRNANGGYKLLAKSSEGDMIVREACYHEHCMTKFRNKFLNFPNDQENDVKDVQKSLEAIAYAECMSFTELSVKQWSSCTFHKIVSYSKILFSLP